MNKSLEVWRFAAVFFSHGWLRSTLFPRSEPGKSTILGVDRPEWRFANLQALDRRLLGRVRFSPRSSPSRHLKKETHRRRLSDQRRGDGPEAGIGTPLLAGARRRLARHRPARRSRPCPFLSKVSPPMNAPFGSRPEGQAYQIKGLSGLRRLLRRRPAGYRPSAEVI